MESFTAAMTYSSKKDFAIKVPNAVSQELCKFISTEIRIMEKAVKWYDPKAGIEPGMEASFSWYCPTFFEALSLTIQPIIEENVNRSVFPSYTYGRIYREDGVLEKHLDRRSSEYTVSVCLDKEKTVDWALCVQREDKSIDKFYLDIGDLLIYPGRDLVHWREGLYTGGEQVQAFVQYVDADGDSIDLKYDGRPQLGLPFDTSQTQQHNLDRMSDLVKKTTDS